MGKELWTKTNLKLQMAIIIKLYNYYNLLTIWNSCKRFTLAVNLRYNIGF